MHLTVQLPHQKRVIPGPLVLGNEPRKFPAPTVDKDRTVSRRSEPSSRTALTGEQPDPWDLLQPQDAMSRHRGAKPIRRYELLESISLLSLAYLLSVERRQFHILTVGSFGPAFASARLVCLAVNRAYTHTLVHMVANHVEPSFALLRYLLGGSRPSQTDPQTLSLPWLTGMEVRILIHKEWCFTFRLAPGLNPGFNVSHLRYAS
jgi:hypothetical protein